MFRLNLEAAKSYRKQTMGNVLRPPSNSGTSEEIEVPRETMFSSGSGLIGYLVESIGCITKFATQRNASILWKLYSVHILEE